MIRSLTPGVRSTLVTTTVSRSGGVAAAATSSSSRAQPVVEGACLSRTTFPAMTAGARARITCQ